MMPCSHRESSETDRVRIVYLELRILGLQGLASIDGVWTLARYPSLPLEMAGFLSGLHFATRVA
jgi:hypothetical protein